jgi:hypothetical protein
MKKVSKPTRNVDKKLDQSRHSNSIDNSYTRSFKEQINPGHIFEAKGSYLFSHNLIGDNNLIDKINQNKYITSIDKERIIGKFIT